MTLQQVTNSCDSCIVEEKSVDPNSQFTGIQKHVGLFNDHFQRRSIQVPFHPGLALGSVVRIDHLEGMQCAADAKAIIKRLEEQIRSDEQEIIHLSERDISKDDLMRSKLLPSLLNRIQMLTKQLGCAYQLPPARPFFHQSIESPIDLARSQMVNKPLSFDSLRFHSYYVRSEEDVVVLEKQLASIHPLVESLEQLSYLELTQVFQRLREIQREKQSFGTFLIYAIATKRNVRSFANIQYAQEKLCAIYQVMDSGSQEEKKIHGISEIHGELVICLLTQAVMGGEFAGFVTLLKKEESAFTELANVQDLSTLQSRLKDISEKDLKIEIYSHGAIPYLKSNRLHHKQSLTVDSVFEAYRSFVKQMAEDESAGIPFGFHYEILTKNDIKKLLSS